MDDKKITAEEMATLLAGDFQEYVEQMTAAMNEAKAGSIISDSELPVFEASGEFRRKTYEKVIDLVQQKHEAFSPSAQRAPEQGTQNGSPRDDQR
jgi:hypothetical protein